MQHIRTRHPLSRLRHVSWPDDVSLRCDFTSVVVVVERDGECEGIVSASVHQGGVGDEFP